jgi:hypothetical protein
MKESQVIIVVAYTFLGSAYYLLKLLKFLFQGAFLSCDGHPKNLTNVKDHV